MTDPQCHAIRESLLDFNRNRLTPEARREIERHLETCGECRALAERERVLDEALGRLPARPAPSSLQARLLASAALAVAAAKPRDDRSGLASKAMSEHTSPVRRRVVIGVVAGLAAAVGILFGVLGFNWNERQNSELLVSEAVNDHLRVLYDSHALEVESGGLHQVKPWFEGRVDFAPVLEFEGDADFVLAGGSVGYFVDRKAAVFQFKRRLHLVSVFVFRADGLPWPRAQRRAIGRVNAFVTRSRGFSTVLYRDGDLGYALVSDVDPPTLEKLVEKLAPAAAP